jgi:hypothetical protein
MNCSKIEGLLSMKKAVMVTKKVLVKTKVLFSYCIAHHASMLHRSHSHIAIYFSLFISTMKIDNLVVHGFPRREDSASLAFSLHSVPFSNAQRPSQGARIVPMPTFLE